MNRTIQILYVILIFSLIPRVGNAQSSRTMSVEKIEICSIGKVFTPIQLSRFSWLELWISIGSRRSYITDKKDIDWIICNLGSLNPFNNFYSQKFGRHMFPL